MENCPLAWQVKVHSAMLAEVGELATLTPELLCLVRNEEKHKAEDHRKKMVAFVSLVLPQK